MRNVVIIGNGISGITAARFIRKRSDVAITIVSSESPYFISRTALMYAYMGQIREQDLKPYPDSFWSKNRLSLVLAHATAVQVDKRVVHLSTGERLPYDRLILATGSRPNRFGWEGEYLPGVQGLYSMQDLALLEENTKNVSSAVVVGGGLVGVELVEMLLSRGIRTTFLVRERGYMDYLLPDMESEMIRKHVRRHNVDLRLSTELRKIEKEDNGRVCAVVTGSGERIETDFVGLTAGVSPNTDLADASGIETRQGILVDRMFETSAENVFAIGDCAEFRDPLENGRHVEQIWYSGRNHGRRLGLNLTGLSEPYRQDVFYNSAKFFDLEYQTYGAVLPEEPATNRSIVYHDPVRELLLRIVYRDDTRAVVGFSAMGIRISHNVCAAWIRNAASVDEVVENLRRADFNSEFSSLITSGMKAELGRQASPRTSPVV